MSNDISDFVCQRCGSCCKGIRITFGKGDLDRWDAEERHDILKNILVGASLKGDIVFMPGDEYSRSIRDKEHVVLGTFGWYDPKEDVKLSVCPHLNVKADGSTSCKIYDLRPNACRNFPFTQQESGGLRTGIKVCPAF